MFDCHCHILPGIDDGSPDLETSLAMGRMAVLGGTKTILATPHVLGGKWLPTWEKITAACQELQQAFDEHRIALTVLPGSEFFMDMSLLPLIPGPGAYCLNGGNHLLVELPAVEVPAYAEDFFFALQARGITPVLAHPERYAAFHKDARRLYDWAERGVLLQVNAPSFSGRNGEKARQMVEALVRGGHVQLLGSDAHSARTRHPDMKSGLAAVEALGEPTVCERLTYVNPPQLLAGKALAPMPTIKTNQRRSWWDKLINRN